MRQFTNTTTNFSNANSNADVSGMVARIHDSSDMRYLTRDCDVLRPIGTFHTASAGIEMSGLTGMFGEPGKCLAKPWNLGIPTGTDRYLKPVGLDLSQLQLLDCQHQRDGWQTQTGILNRN